MAMSVAEYAQQLRNLMPRGLAWSRLDDSVLGRLLSSFAAEASRVDSRADDLLRETDPRSTNELIGEWESMLGLPDECTVGALTLAERRSAVIAKLTSRFGQRPADYLSLAKALGYPSATITQYRSRRYGRSTMGGTYGGVIWQHVWRLNLASTRFQKRTSGSPVSEPYGVWGDWILECVISKHCRADDIVKFSYGGI